MRSLQTDIIRQFWEIRKLLMSNTSTRYYTLMNASVYNESPQENTVPAWLLPCTCDTSRCQCNARLKPDILCVLGHPYNSPPPVAPTSAITIQYIEFTYCNDRFHAATIERKTIKYQPLIDNLISNGWQVAPLLVLASGARATTHILPCTRWKHNSNYPLNKLKTHLANST